MDHNVISFLLPALVSNQTQSLNFAQTFLSMLQSKCINTKAFYKGWKIFNLCIWKDSNEIFKSFEN